MRTQAVTAPPRDSFSWSQRSGRTTTMGWEWHASSWPRRGLEDDARHLRHFVRDFPLHWGC
ncbi:hypothetical protein EJB05_40962, partial [Eragrostis curvula]